MIGIDEVGRGSLAGPVVVAAVAMPQSRVKLELHSRTFANDTDSRAVREIPLWDSKKLTARRREAWDAHLRAHPHIHFALARVYPRGIERMNISRAANLASVRACIRLLNKCKITKGIRVFLDGGLYLSPHRGSSRLPVRSRVKAGIKTQICADTYNIRVNPRRYLRVSATTIVRGDEKIKAVAAASIIAKVHRDRYMARLAKKHPHYGFEVHKGYGTKMHRAAIRKYGPSKAHRLTFLSKFYRVYRV